MTTDYSQIKVPLPTQEGKCGVAGTCVENLTKNANWGDGVGAAINKDPTQEE